MPHTATILTVDDNDALRYSLTRTLRGEGYKVLEARTGAEALALADQFPDLITLDLNLPDFDGFEVCRRLRANPQTAHIPILHISATFVEPQHRGTRPRRWRRWVSCGTNLRR
jgi:CheY-like chemotaxis protein